MRSASVRRWWGLPVRGPWQVCFHIPLRPLWIPRGRSSNHGTENRPYANDWTRAGDEWSGNNLVMKFCWCPPGDFKMGDAPNQVDVKLTRGFWLGKYEVTQAEYREVMKR